MDKNLRDEGQVCNGELVADQPLTLREYTVEDAYNADDLLPVAFDRAGQLFAMEVVEVERLAVERSLIGYLEGHPLELQELVLFTGCGDPVFRVVLGDEVRQDGTRVPAQKYEDCSSTRASCMSVPEGEVIVVVVNDGGDTAVGIDRRVAGALVLTRPEIEVLRLVCETELLEDYGDLPSNR